MKYKITAFLLSVFLLLCCACSGKDNRTSVSSEKSTSESMTVDDTTAAESSSEQSLLGGKKEDMEPVSDPYLRQYMSSLYKEGRILLSNNMKKISSSEDTDHNGVLFKGPVSHYNGGRISLLGNFDFSNSPVRRISISGITDTDHDVHVKIYLDKEDEPVASFKLDHTNEEMGWDNGYEHTRDVYGKISSGTHQVSLAFDIEDAKGNENVNILLRHLEFAEDPGIPTIYFNIDESRGTIDEMNASLDHTVRCYGSIRLEVPESFISDYTGGISESADLAMSYVQGRGNSTWKEDSKKPYKFKLDKKTDLFGMGKNKNWALIANRFDNSLIRNRMTYWLGAELSMEFTPQCIPVDVVMNDMYYGSYLLAENIRIDEGRVNIDELKEEDVQDPEVTGGYIIAMNPYYEEDERSIFTTKKMVRFLNDTPDFAPEEGDDDFHGNDIQRDYVRNYLQKTEDAIFSEGFTDEDGNTYVSYLDMDAAVNYWWVQEFCANGDAYITDSTRLYKKRGDKLFFGPLWDFDYVAWGNLQDPGNYKNTGFSNTTTLWIDRMMEDPAFISKLEERWPAVNEKITEIVRDGGLLDRYYEQMLISERYDNEKLGFFSGGLGSQEEKLRKKLPDDYTYREEINRLRDWIKGRQDWINEHMNELKDQIKTVTYTAFDEDVEVQKIRYGKRLSDIPKAPEREGYIFTGWFTEDDREADIWLSVNEDLTFYGRYLDEESATKADHLYLKYSNVWGDINEIIYTPLYRTTPIDALVNTVYWTSSDESIASVDKDGHVEMKKTGTVTITGKLKTGYSDSYNLTIYDSTVTPPVLSEALTVEQSSVTVHVGESFQNKVSFLPKDQPVKDPWIMCSSEDPSIALADPYGIITGGSPGTTTITVTDMTSDASVSFEVTVLQEEGNLKATDPVSETLDLLRRLNDTIKPSDYTKESYAAYVDAFGRAVDRLENDDIIMPILLEDLKMHVFRAYYSLEKK